MGFTPQDWHQRFKQQARWTQDLRAYLYQRARIENARRVLEVGCGTGAILVDLPAQIPLQVGLDLSSAHLNLAIRKTSGKLTCGDAHRLPYQDETFDLTLCHFLLLWVADPTRVASEMVRVTRPGGAVLACAEPDYGGRIDYPEELAILGKWQMESLQHQGADPRMGRKLAGIFSGVGLQAVETGALGGQWSGLPDWEAWESEWAVLESDLTKISEITPQNGDEISKVQKLKEIDRLAYQQGKRVLFVPTFYAWGIVPK